MSKELETLKQILSAKLPEADVEALMAELTIASGRGAVAIQGDATEAVIIPGNQSIAGNHNRYTINQGIDSVKLVEMICNLLREIKTFEVNTSSNEPQRFPEIFRFDLIQLIQKCLGEFYDKCGLVGLAVPCDEQRFLTNFCERLKYELKRDKVQIQIRQTLSLSPQVISVSKAVDKVKQYKTLLQNSDVICPVRMDVYDSNSNLSEDFWQQIQDSFQNDFKCRLIVVMFGKPSCIFPKDALHLNPPQFEKVHAIEWIRDITKIKSWGQVMNDWIRKMLDYCLCDEQTGCLDVCQVYEHLEYTLSILQSNPSLSAEAFLEQLD